MRKIILVLSLVATFASVSNALVTVTATAGSPLMASLYNASSVALPVGYYAELIIKDGDPTYNFDITGQTEFDSWTTVASGYQQGTDPLYNKDHATIGKLSSGSLTYAGVVGFKWQYSTYANTYYAAIRFYDGTDKTTAKYFGVTSAIKFTTVDPTQTKTQALSWNTSTTNTNNRFYATHENPLAIPEPATMALFGLGGLALVIRRKLRKEV